MRAKRTKRIKLAQSTLQRRTPKRGPTVSRSRTGPSQSSSQPSSQSPSESATAPTLRDCLAPLVAGALQTSLLAHQWGVRNHSLMRASSIMELAAWTVQECNRLLLHQESAGAVREQVRAQVELAKKSEEGEGRGRDGSAVTNPAKVLALPPEERGTRP